MRAAGPCWLRLIRWDDCSVYLDVGPYRLRYMPPGVWRPLSERYGYRKPAWERGRFSILGRVAADDKPTPEADPTEVPVVWSANWQGAECEMCRGTGVYPYKPAAGITWAVCAACNGHGKEPSEPRDGDR